MDRPPIVSEQEWRSARDALLVKEKAATRALDALAAERRRLPMVRIEKSYRFESPRGPASLVDLFEGRRQLVLYHFMFAPGTVHPCEGCSTFTDNVGDLTHLQQRDTTFALTARAPVAELEAFERRIGLDRTLVLDGRIRFQPRLRAHHRRRARDVRTERLPAGRRRGVPDVPHERARGRSAPVRLQPARPDAVRPPGAVGGLAPRVAADAAVWLVATPRRVRARDGLTVIRASPSAAACAEGAGRRPRSAGTRLRRRRRRARRAGPARDSPAPP